MNQLRVVFKRAMLAVLCCATIYLLWQHFFPRSENKHPIVRLSLFVDEHIDEILGPLPLSEEGIIPSPSFGHDLIVLRESIKDLERVSPTRESLRYSTAVRLCNELLVATKEREEHIVRINDTRSKNSVSPLAANPEQNRKERLAYFQNGIDHSWAEASSKLRRMIDRTYSKLREFERRGS